MPTHGCPRLPCPICNFGGEPVKLPYWFEPHEIELSDEQLDKIAKRVLEHRK